MTMTIENRTEHMILQSENGRYKASLQPLGPLSADPDVVWSKSKLTVFDLEKECLELFSYSSNIAPETAKFVTVFGAIYLLIADFVGGYVVLNCETAESVHYIPTEEDDVWVWRRIIRVVENDDGFIAVVVEGCISPNAVETRQYATKNLLRVPYELEWENDT